MDRKIIIITSIISFIICAASGREMIKYQNPSTAPASRPPYMLIDKTSLEACGACHADVYEEWDRSLHHYAWTNANVRDATKNFSMAGCRACHSPMSVFETGFESRPAFRDYNHDDGVHCLSCHGLKDGVAANRTIPDAPCRPRVEPILQKAESCYPCHEPTHQAFSEYYLSNAYKTGKRCLDCHMPEREGGKGRSHGPHGGLNGEFVKKAVEWKCEERNDTIFLTVTNKTGHKFPGEIPSRSFVMKVEMQDCEPVYQSIRKPNKGEAKEDDRLKPDETRVFEFKIKKSAFRKLTLLFKPFPIMPDEAAIEIGSWTPR